MTREVSGRTLTALLVDKAMINPSVERASHLKIDPATPQILGP
jgi:hypothetical protein